MTSPRPKTDPAVVETAKDVAIMWLLRQAYSHGAWHHARTNIEMQSLAPEVKAVLFEALDRNEA